MLGGNPTGTGGVSPYTYLWIPTPGLNNITLANPTATIMANAMYAVVVKDNNNCENIDTVHILYNPNSVHAEAGYGSDSMCTGGTLMLGGNPTAVGGITPYTYAWIPVLGLTNPSIPNPIATVTSNSTYVVLIHDGSGCEDVDSVVVVYNSDGPVADAGLGDGSLCIGRNILLGGNPSATGGAAPYTYVWNPVSWLNSPTVANPTASSLMSNMVYYLTIVDAAGCTSIDSAVVNIIGTGVLANFSATPVTGYEQLAVQFTNQSSGPGLSYQWLFGDGGTSTDINPSHTYSNLTDSTIHYNITLITTDMYGCSDTVVFSSLVNLNSSSTVIYTNVFTPNGDGINDVYTFDFMYLGNCTISIFNRWGQLVFETNTPNAEWDGRTASGSKANDGVYYYMFKGTALDGKTYEKMGYIQVIR